MPQNLLSGKTGSVLIGTVSMSFGKWKAAFKTNLPKVNNWNSTPYQALVSGLTSGTLTISGPYDEGNMPFVCGNSYTFILGFTDTINLTCTVLIESIDAENDVDGAPSISITGQSNGSFTAAIV